jgi:hypothetical protein
LPPRQPLAPPRPQQISSEDFQEHRISQLEDDVGEIKDQVSSVEADVKSANIGIQEIKIQLAGKNHELQKMIALLSLAGTVLSMLGNYIMRPSPQPPAPSAQIQNLTPEMLEKLRLAEQRDGYRMGQRPWTNEPIEIRDAGTD